jgi:hypothetical protein
MPALLTAENKRIERSGIIRVMLEITDGTEEPLNIGMRFFRKEDI